MAWGKVSLFGWRGCLTTPPRHLLEYPALRGSRHGYNSGDKLEALYVLALNSGLRQGELLALKWEDVELEDAVLRVRHTLTRTGGKVTLGPPKTNKSRRSVRLTSGAVEVLRAHRSRQ